MKYLIVFLALIGIFGAANAEETFFGYSSVDPPISEITPRKPTAINVMFQYTSGPYALTELTPKVEISPESVIDFVKIDVEPIEINQREIRRMPIILTVDQNIEHEKIFLSISFSGKHFQTGSVYKSSWIESLTLDIAPKDTIEISLGDCKPVDIDFEISGGKASVICKSQSDNAVKAFVDAKSNGTITLDIPKHVLYALGSTDCRLDNDFLVFYDGKGIASDIHGKSDSNLVSVDFEPGIHEIQVIGFTIIPDPSPAQYCGIVENHSKLYLAPLDQIQHDMKPTQIICNDDLVLVYKYDDSPACVNRDTIPKLIQRGWIDVDPRLEAEKNIPKFLCEMYGGGFFDGTGECMDLGSIRKCQMLGGVWNEKCMVPRQAKGIETEPDPNPTPEPEPEQTSEEERLQQEKQDQARTQTQKEIMADYRGNQHQVDAISKYREQFEPGYFLEQFVVPNKQNFKKDEVINFVVGQWGYQPEKCVSYIVKGYFKPYHNYEDPFYVEKISQWESTECNRIISSDSNGHVIVNMQPMPGIPEEHQTCGTPGEYRILVQNPKDETHVEWGYYTCQRDKLVGEPQPWMELPE